MRVCGQCHLPGALRRGRAPSPRAGPARQPVRRLPHAGQDLHGGRPAPRSRLQGAAARSRRPHRGARRLHRLPRGPGTPPGPRARGRVVRPGPAPRAELRRGAGGRPPGPPGAGARLAKLAGDPEHAGDRPGDRGRGARAPTRPAGLRRRRSAASSTRTRWSGWPPSAPWASVDPRLRARAGRCRCSTTRSAPSGWRRPACWRPCPPATCRRTGAPALDAAFAAYEAAQSKLLDRPEGLITLANFYRERGRLVEAEARLADSIRLHPGFVPAYANLADLMRQQGRDPEGERVLQQGLAIAPRQRRAPPRKGLLLIRQQKYREAVAELAAAAEPGARQSPLRLCLRGGAAGDRPGRARRSRCWSGPSLRTRPIPTSCSSWRRRSCSRATRPVRADMPRRWCAWRRRIEMLQRCFGPLGWREYALHLQLRCASLMQLRLTNSTHPHLLMEAMLN